MQAAPSTSIDVVLYRRSTSKCMNVVSFQFQGRLSYRYKRDIFPGSRVSEGPHEKLKAWPNYRTLLDGQSNIFFERYPCNIAGQVGKRCPTLLNGLSNIFWGSERGKTREWIKKRKEWGMFITMKELKMHKEMMRWAQSNSTKFCKQFQTLFAFDLIGCLIGFSTTSSSSAILSTNIKSREQLTICDWAAEQARRSFYPMQLC